MSEAPRTGVICVGNWIVDIVHDIDRWPQRNDLVRILASTIGVGGGAANVLSDLRSFGADFLLIPVGKIGSDAFGDLVLDHCRKFGFPTGFMGRDDTVPTAYTHVMNLSEDSRTFFYNGGANDSLCETDIPIAALAEKNAKLFYLGYPMLLQKLDAFQKDGSTQAASVLKQARMAGMLTCVDLVSTDSPHYRETIAAALPHIDYLVLNETELSRASGMNILGAREELDRTLVLRAARELFSGGVARAVVVHSPKIGLWLSESNAETWVDPQRILPEEIKSPVGAGDAFCAGIIYGVHQEWAAEKTLILAHRAARAALGGKTATDSIQPISELMPGQIPLGR